jgi:transposase
MAYCKGCFEKQVRIDELLEENKQLKARLRYRERKEKEGFFGASTPSSKIPVKETTAEENRQKKGGAVYGHEGHGRKSHGEEKAVVFLESPGVCPVCGGELAVVEMRDRAVIESTPTKPERLLYKLPHARCKNCKKLFRTNPPGVLPKSLYGNQLTAQLAAMHYVHGIPIGRISEMTGINAGSIIEIYHRLFRLFKPVIETFTEEYRLSYVRHADETGWRNDGQSGYAWLFCTASLSIFLFRNTRSSSVPKGVFGEEELPGVLVVDRYAGYNKLPVSLQYCYAHLLRDVEKLEKDWPDDEETVRFAASLIPLLTHAMRLRSQDILDEEYCRQAEEIKERIMAICRSPAHHLGIRSIQDIFTVNEGKLFHWVQDRDVPADNNYAERNLRPTVIARKVSFGSSSDAGAETRSVLMSVLHTLNKRRREVPLESVFKAILDKIAENPAVNVTSLLPPPVTPIHRN